MTRLNLNLNPFVLFSIFVVISWTLFSPCHAGNYRVLEGLIKGDNTTVGQSQDANSTLANNSTLLLAAERTRRIDPSDFKYYEAGWDITNEHYLQSLAFSGSPLFVIAVLWFFAVAIFTILACCCCCCICCRRKKSKSKRDHSRKAYAISLILLSLFLIITIIGGIILYTGQMNFQSTTKDVLVVLVKRVNTVVDIVHDVLSNLEAAKDIQIGQFKLPDNIKKSIANVEGLANKTASIKRLSEDTQKLSARFLNSIGRALVAVTTLMLLLAVVGFMISCFGWKLIVYILLFIGWILVTGTFILGGTSLIVRNGVGDTCVAVEELLQRTRDHTALSKILPCMDEAAAQTTLDLTRNTTSQMVTLVNAFVSNVANAKVPPSAKDVYYNQSGPLMPFLCNPFFPNLTERTCGPSEVELKAAPKTYQGFICETSQFGLCITMGRLTPSHYTNIMVATNLSDTLHQHGPVLTGLVDCSFAVETFTQISKEDCPSLRRNSSQVFIGLVLVSFAVMFSVILWVVFVKERRSQISYKKLKKAHVEAH